MGAGPITFAYTDWIGQYPTFANVSQPFAQICFDTAGDFCDNTAQSMVPTTERLTRLLYLLTCHIAWLTAPQINGLPNTGTGSVPPPQLVGRISSATEGSVSVQTESLGLVGSAAWFAQTQWGFMYWQLSALFRMARYVPGPPALGPLSGRWPLPGSFGRGFR